VIGQIVERARQEGRALLLEHELYEALSELGLPVPSYQFIPIEQIRAGRLDRTAPALAGARGVLKVVSAEILHKSDVGGVVFIDEISVDTVLAAAGKMLESIPGELIAGVRGVLLAELVHFDRRLGAELLLGMRRSPDFGVVFSLGFGGTYTEALATATRPNQGNILFSQGVTSPEQLKTRLEDSLFFRFATGRIRGISALCEADVLREWVDRWIEGLGKLAGAVSSAGASVEEFEINPLVWDGARLVAVDALLRLGPDAQTAGVQRADKANLRRALNPRRVAIIGVSRTANVGRTILHAMIEGGYPKEDILIVRGDTEEIEGVRCVPTLSEASECGPIDMLVVSVAAAQVPEVLADAIAAGNVSSLLLIPGGMGETEAGKEVEQAIVKLLSAQPPEKRPVLIGNNTLGIVSRPVSFDSLFVARKKLPRPEAGSGHVALISQSGAFMITTLNKLEFVNPDYQLSIGNQIDARLSDYVEMLAEVDTLTTFALYIEGFRPGDGERTAAAVKRLSAAGKDVIVYKGGRTQLGQHATMGHTASIAGDYRVFEELMQDAGALLADTVPDFVDFMRLSATLSGRRFGGNRFAMLSNAGYEVVSMADNHRGEQYELVAAQLGTATRQRLQEILLQFGLDSLVNVSNPLDLTPMADDEVNDLCMRALLDDPAVDAGVFGCVPFTSRLKTLPPGILDGDSVEAPDGFAARTARIFEETDKPFIMVIDAGSLYDPLANAMQGAGIPVFRSAGRAVRLLGRYVMRRLDA